MKLNILMDTYPGNEIPGWMVPKELQWLFRQARQMNSVVEVGSWFGRSTHALLSGCRGPVWAVDHWMGNLGSDGHILHCCQEVMECQDVFAEFQKNVGHFQNLTAIKAPSLEAVKQFLPKSVDMVFIDGGHLYDEVKADILAWRDVARLMICGHDYSPDVWPGVTQAVNEIFGSHGTGFFIHESIWFRWLV